MGVFYLYFGADAVDAAVHGLDAGAGARNTCFVGGVCNGFAMAACAAFGKGAAEEQEAARRKNRNIWYYDW